MTFVYKQKQKTVGRNGGLGGFFSFSLIKMLFYRRYGRSDNGWRVKTSCFCRYKQKREICIQKKRKEWVFDKTTNQDSKGLI